MTSSVNYLASGNGLDFNALRHHCLSVGLFDGCRCAVLGGSAAKGEQYNDLDILLFFDSAPIELAQVLFWKGVRIEVFNYTVDAFRASVEDDARVGRFGKASFIQNGLVLLGEDWLGSVALLDFVNRIDKNGPPPFDRVRAAFFFSERLADLRKAKNEIDGLASVLALANGFEQSFHPARGEWLLTGKHFLRDLSRRHPEIYNEFLTAFKLAIAGHTAPLCDFIESWYKSNCGQVPDRIVIRA